MAAWIERHLDRFLAWPVWTGGVLRASPLTPFNELSLVLYALTSPAHREAHLPSFDWANRVSAILFEHAEDLAEEMDWKRLADYAREHPHAALDLLAYPLLAILAGKRPAFKEQLTLLLTPPFTQAQQETYERRLDYAWMFEIAGLGDCRTTMSERLDKWVEHEVAANSRVRLSSLYELTHIIFYGTQFGRRPLVAARSSFVWLDEHLGRLGMMHLVQDNYDIGAELLLGRLYSRQRFDDDVVESARYLCTRVPADGGVPGPRRSQATDEFAQCYHTTLVSLMALTESHVRISNLTPICEF
jgi:hypothetical protein